MKNIILFILLILIACINGCVPKDKNITNEVNEISEISDASPRLNFVMTCSPSVISLTTDTIYYTITITNNTEYVALTGDAYTIRYYNNTEWVDFPFRDDIMFNLIGYELYADISNTWTKRLLPRLFKYELKRGKYRIYKRISINDYRYAGDKEYITYADFILE